MLHVAYLVLNFMRRILIILAAIVVLLGAGGYVYWRYFADTPGLVVTEPTTLPTSPTTPGGGAAGADAGTATKVTSRLTKIAAGPVVPGVAVVTIPAANASSTADVDVRFIERQSGNIYSYLMNAGTLTRTSNKPWPGIQWAAWLPSGQTAIVRYLGDDVATISTYGLAVDGSGGFFLPQNLADVAVSSTSLLTLASGATGSVASLSGVDGVYKATAFASPLSALRVGFAGSRGYLAFTKPSQSLMGTLFRVSAGGIFSRIAGPLPGLIALGNHTGTVALVSTSAGGVMRMVLVDTSTGATTPLPLSTLADKCVWTADDAAIYCGVPIAPSLAYSYPADWYQGAVALSDRIWKIDVKGRFAQFVFDPQASSVGELDAQALALDPRATVLVFVNKNDGSLWSYQL